MTLSRRRGGGLKYFGRYSKCYKRIKQGSRHILSGVWSHNIEPSPTLAYGECSDIPSPLSYLLYWYPLPLPYPLYWYTQCAIFHNNWYRSCLLPQRQHVGLERQFLLVLQGHLIALLVADITYVPARIKLIHHHLHQPSYLIIQSPPNNPAPILPPLPLPTFLVLLTYNTPLSLIKLLNQPPPTQVNVLTVTLYHP